MESTSLNQLAEEQLDAARGSSGRAAVTTW
jgi:hypothetical protein